MTDEQPHRQPEQTCEIWVRGHMGETTRRAFPALDAEIRGHDTVLRGNLPDDSALYGVLAQIEAIGLGLLEVRRLPRRGSSCVLIVAGSCPPRART